jgi:hypothetical protein
MSQSMAKVLFVGDDDGDVQSLWDERFETMEDQSLTKVVSSKRWVLNRPLPPIARIAHNLRPVLAWSFLVRGHRGETCITGHGH